VPRTLDPQHDHLDHGDLALPEFEDRLLTVLRAAHRHQRSGAAGPVASVRRARRPLAAAAVAALILGTALSVTDRTSVGGPNDQPAIGLDAQVIAAIDQALEESVVHTVQHGPNGGIHESWVDERTGAHRFLQLDPRGRPLFETGVAQAPEVGDGPLVTDPAERWISPDRLPRRLVRTVDHCFSSYIERSEPALPARSAAWQVRSGLADGTLRADGVEVRGGRSLLRVVSTVRNREDSAHDVTAPGDDGVVTYVDPENHRPVLVIGHAGTDAAYEMTISYLPRTPEHLAALAPHVPDGHRRVSELRSDGERLAGGCG
jgi:hypothetical protein